MTFGSPLLRAPFAKQNAGPSHYNYGIIIEKTGEDNNLSKKQRVMHLYSKTIHRGSGRIVCSQDWRDYKLGEWIRFNTSKDENYFGSESMPDFLPTRRSQLSDVIVQVYTKFFFMPDFISCRQNRIGIKIWCPDLGLAYVDHKSAKYLQLRENVVYEGWVQWATNKLNFDNLDIDPCGWSYEPDVYWHVFHDEEQDLKTVRQAHAYLREETEKLRQAALYQTELEALRKSSLTISLEKAIEIMALREHDAMMQEKSEEEEKFKPKFRKDPPKEKVHPTKEKFFPSKFDGVPSQNSHNFREPRYFSDFGVPVRQLEREEEPFKPTKEPFKPSKEPFKPSNDAPRKSFGFSTKKNDSLSSVFCSLPPQNPQFMWGFGDTVDNDVETDRSENMLKFGSSTNKKAAAAEKPQFKAADLSLSDTVVPVPPVPAPRTAFLPYLEAIPVSTQIRFPATISRINMESMPRDNLDNFLEPPPQPKMRPTLPPFF